MGIFDKAKDLLGQHGDQVDQGIDKAADLIDQRTGGQHGAQIDSAAEQVKSRLDEFAGTTGETTPGETTPPAAPAADQPPV